MEVKPGADAPRLRRVTGVRPARARGGSSLARTRSGDAGAAPGPLRRTAVGRTRLFPRARHERAQSADEHAIDYEWLIPKKSVNVRWPAFRVPEDWDALYAPSSGFLLAAESIHAMGAVASPRRTILENTRSSPGVKCSAGVWVATPKRSGSKRRL